MSSLHPSPPLSTQCPLRSPENGNHRQPRTCVSYSSPVCEAQPSCRLGRRENMTHRFSCPVKSWLLFLQNDQSMGEMQIIGGDDLSTLAGKVGKRQVRCVCPEGWCREEVGHLRLGPRLPCVSSPPPAGEFMPTDV